MARAELVFVGTAVEVTNSGRWASFAVEDIWKGQLDGDRADVQGGPRTGFGTSNNRTYAADTRYLVFAFGPPSDPRLLARYGEGVRYTDNACSLTDPYSQGLAQGRPSTARLIGAAPPSEPPRVETVPSTTAPSTGMPAGAGELRQGWGLVIAIVVVGGVVGTVGAGQRHRGPPKTPASQGLLRAEPPDEGGGGRPQ